MSTNYNALPKRHRIKNIPKAVLESLIKESTSIADVIYKLNLNLCGAQYTAFKQKIKAENIDISGFSNIRFTKNALKKITIPLENILVENSKYRSIYRLKVRLVEAGILNYSCAICNNGGIWNGDKLSLQLDHINGVRDDHRKENLRFLCPNCHSQTETYAGKNREKIEKVKTILKPRQTKIVWPHPDDIRLWLQIKPATIVAKELGVSDSALGKFCKKHNIIKFPRGYWQKINASQAM